MTIKERFVDELGSRKYAASTIESYLGCLTVILRELGETPDLWNIKKFLSKIENPNTHKQYTATLRHYFKFILKKKISLNDIPYPRKSTRLQVVLSEEEMKRLIDINKIIRIFVLLSNMKKFKISPSFVPLEPVGSVG